MDRLIPVDEFYPLHIHPFRTEAEQAAEMEEINSRTEIWDKFLSLFEGCDEKDSNTFDEEAPRDEPPILEKVEPIVPINSSNGTPPMPEIEEKKNRKKSVPNNVNTSEKRLSDRARRRKSQRASIPVTCDLEEKEDSFTIKHIKSFSGGKYYCQYDKTGYGKGFFVVGKRSSLENGAEYMVQWDV